jgi:hypothetical protein
MEFHEGTNILTFTSTQIAKRKTNEQKSSCCNDNSWNGSDSPWVNHLSATEKGQANRVRNGQRRQVHAGRSSVL